MLLGQLQYGFPWPDAKFQVDEDVKYLPLADVWQKWWKERPKETRAKDGFELLRALALLQQADDPYGERPAAAAKAAPPPPRTSPRRSSSIGRCGRGRPRNVRTIPTAR